MSADECQLAIGSDDICGLSADSPVHQPSHPYPNRHEFIPSARVAQLAEHRPRKSEDTDSTSVPSSKPTCKHCGKDIEPYRIAESGWVHTNDGDYVQCGRAAELKIVEEPKLMSNSQGFTEEQRSLTSTIVHHKLDAANRQKDIVNEQKAINDLETAINARRHNIQVATAQLDIAIKAVIKFENALKLSILNDILIKGVPKPTKEEEKSSESVVELEQIGRME